MSATQWPCIGANIWRHPILSYGLLRYGKGLVINIAKIISHVNPKINQELLFVGNVSLSLILWSSAYFLCKRYGSAICTFDSCTRHYIEIPRMSKAVFDLDHGWKVRCSFPHTHFPITFYRVVFGKVQHMSEKCCPLWQRFKRLDWATRGSTVGMLHIHANFNRFLDISTNREGAANAIPVTRS